MASWDGSYHNPEDPRYFLHSNGNVLGTDNHDWAVFPGNRNSAFPQDTQNHYQQADSMRLEQSSPVFYNIDQSLSTRPYGSADPIMDFCYGEQVTAANSSSISNERHFSDSSGMQQSTLYYCRENANHRKKQKSSKENRQQAYMQWPSNVEHFTLQATAEEFAPNGTRAMAQEGSRFEDSQFFTGDGVSSSQSSNLTTVPFFPNNKDRYNKRQQEDRRTTNYRQRDAVNTATYQKAGVQKRYGRYPNDRFFSGKTRSNNSQENPARGRRRHNAQWPVSSLPKSTSKGGPFTESLQDDGPSVSENIAGDKVTYGVYASNGEVTETTNNGMQPDDRPKRFYKRGSDRARYKESATTGQHQVSSRNTRKHTGNEQIDKFELDYKDRGARRQGYGSTRFNYNKQTKAEKAKDKERNKDVIQEWKDKEPGSWGGKPESSAGKNETPPREEHGKHEKHEKHENDDDASQRERLTQQLNKGELDCLVCCEFIKQTHYIWSCENCYYVLHLTCVKKWAKSSQGENGWRCPACQNVSSAIPEDSYCFCGKVKMPEWNHRDAAHSCGEMCGRSTAKNNCVHKCTLLCHPGPCPSCTATVTKPCGCGRTLQTVQCSALMMLHCDAVCGKKLNCEKHTCEKKCHHGECGPCEKMIQQDCYCGKKNREVTCQADTSTTYSCGDVCGKSLNCEKHNCSEICHPGSCEPCSLTPDKVTTCCCGQSPLTEKRESCLDPIATCDKICSKRLKCGQPDNPHTCQVPCHVGNCPECELTTDVKCRCGNMDRQIACKELTTKADGARCEKKCTKKRSCGKHKCNQLCCIDIEHVCPLPCSKTLSCGRHKCEQTCHKGRCQQCWRTSFDELYCECGNAVIYPPVPCGTRRPTCNKPCSREHPCGHDVLHNCHSEPVCPPCTVLTQKWCYGKHELRKAVPCHVNEISCGMPCSKPLSCGRHKCITLCHTGPCEKPGQRCTQPCTVSRELCGHNCAAPCHEGKCPDSPCKETVKVTCQCGHRSMTRACAENDREYQRIASNILASKMADMQLGHSVDLEEVFGQGAKRQNQLKTLECNDECKTIERNRRLALGLQIVNPDLSGKLMPRYSDFMKQWAKKDPHFCQMVHEKLSELVQLAKTSKQKSRSYSFESMKRDKRYFVHELCQHFGCESQAYDQEPKRNVVATAVKNKCWLPSYSLLEIVQRENGQRKVPGPMLNTCKDNSSVKTVLSLPVNMNQKFISASTSSKSPGPDIDYFNYNN